jgi:hypothetical protein
MIAGQTIVLRNFVEPRKRRKIDRIGGRKEDTKKEKAKNAFVMRMLVFHELNTIVGAKIQNIILLTISI